jgi:peptide/nickel transport system substrate-binding protein
VLAALLGTSLASCSRRAPVEPLRVLLPSDILSLDPNRDIETVTDAVLFNVFESLVGFDDNLEVRPVLAESWEHPRPEQWRFRLRPGVRFHDGTPLTAGAVRDALLELRQSPDRQASDFLGWVKAITVVDELTLDIETHEPRALLGSLPFLYVAKRNAAGTFPPMVGTGPYTVREWTPGQRVVLAASPLWRGQAPAFPDVVLTPVPHAQDRVARLERGEADIVYAVPPELAQESAQARFVKRPGLTVYYLGFDVRARPDNPFRDQRVREAVSLAIDRNAMVETVLHGHGAVPSQPVAAPVFGFDPALAIVTRDDQRARSLLAQAGYPQGFHAVLDVQAERMPDARFLQHDLAGIGIQLEPKALKKEDFFARLRTGQSEMFFLGWNCSTGEASEFYEFAMHSPGGSYGGGNFGGYSNPDVDRIAERNAAELDPRLRKEMLQRAARIVMQDLPVVPLLVADDIYGHLPRVRFRPRADGEIRLADVTAAGARP